MKIAQRFNAGIGDQAALSPEGTIEIPPHVDPMIPSTVRTGLVPYAIHPGVETPGYSHDVLSGQTRMDACVTDQN